MLRLRKLTPLHGWRPFWGEVGIVVLGVLIALGAQQAVETWSWRGQVRDFRAAANKELSENLAAYQFRLAQSQCIERRLDELRRLAAMPEDAPAPRRLRKIGRPLSFGYSAGVWENKDDAVTAHLPGDLRKRYAEIYDEFRNDDANRIRENEAWFQIAQYNLPVALRHEDRLRLTELIERASELAINRKLNYEDAMVGWVRGLNLKPISPSFLKGRTTGFCEPFLAPA